MKTIAASITMSRDADDAETGPDSASPDAPLRDVPVIVGTNLRRLRKARGLSLERLAEQSGVSRAMLGQIETAKSVPTVSLLWRIADALGVPVATLVATDREPAAVVISRESASVVVSSEGRYATRNLLPANRQRETTFFEIRIAPDHREKIAPSEIGTRHNLVVAQGRLTVTIGAGQPIVLEEGDALSFEASSPYSIENTETFKATAYLVVIALAS
jgi:transcriptional regulator with XRE-family HTH domain